MPDFIDYSTADIQTLLSDKHVQQLIKLAVRYPDWSVSNMVLHLRNGRYKHGSRKKPVLSYTQASIILQRLNLATPNQRKISFKKTSESGDQDLLDEFIDYNTADITTLLSDKYVQKLLEIAGQHPDWSVTAMVSQICLHETRYSTTLAHTYDTNLRSVVEF